MDTTLWQPPDETDRESDGVLSGLAVGTVTDNQDPQNLGRVRVHLPWQDGNDTSFWARCAMPMAGKERGVYFLPEVGDEVLVAAEHGDPSFLYVLGSLWNGAQVPPERNQDGKNNIRVIKSRLGHLVRMNDDESAPEIEVSLSDGKHVRLDKDGITIDDHNRNVIKLVAGSGAIEITADQKLTLKAATVSVEASASMTVKSSGTLTLQGSVVQIN